MKSTLQRVLLFLNYVLSHSTSDTLLILQYHYCTMEKGLQPLCITPYQGSTLLDELRCELVSKYMGFSLKAISHEQNDYVSEINNQIIVS